MLHSKTKLAATLILLIAFFSILPAVSAAHYIIGFVNDSFLGNSPNDLIITVWNPSNGISDNVADIIGANGNSGESNTYLVDCEMLSTPCNVGDTLNAKIIDTGSGYTTETASITVTGAGFDVMPDLRLNSPPNVSLNFPLNNSVFSNPNVEFMCSYNDLDSNLANVTLYGNWSNGWHSNQTTSISGSAGSTNFTKILSDGRYHWSCLVSDNLSISRFASQNFTFTLDSSPPSISSIDLNVSGNICGLQDNVRVSCTALDSVSSLSSVLIEAITPSYRKNYTAQFLAGNTYFSDISLNESGAWRFNCIANDTLGNAANRTSQTLSVGPNATDIAIISDSIQFSTLEPVENSLVTINATFYNNGCNSGQNFTIGFFEGNPQQSATQIGSNITVALDNGENSTINITWPAKIGTTNIFVYADLINSVLEINETNNAANRTIFVGGWQDFYGNVTIDKILAAQNVRNISLWFNETSLSGNIFIVDSESNVNWNSLQAIGKNKSNSNTTNDFTEIDSILDMASLSDSISNMFTTDGNSLKSSTDFLVYKQNITQVPVINSTNNTNFITGMLWDTSDDTNGEFSQAEKEDLVFLAKINKEKQGAYGLYDYEISIPARLREYHTGDTSEVFIYFDLN